MPAVVTHYDFILGKNMAIHMADEEDRCGFCGGSDPMTVPFITPRARAEELKLEGNA